jgi:hypothetical protein
MTAYNNAPSGRRPGAGPTRLAMLVLAGWAVMGISCQKKPAATEPSDDDTHSTTASSPAVNIAPPRADSQDDPAGPRSLPRSGEVQGWIKTEAIRVFPTAKMADAVADPGVTRVLKAYRIERLATCVYTGPNATARALLVEAESAADAFGIFSMLDPHSSCSPRDDNSMRSTRRVGQIMSLSAWQGRNWVRFDCKLDNETGAKECERLVNRTVFSMIAADPPMLMRAVRDIKTQHCELRLVRSARLLAGIDDETLRHLDGAAVDERLGLAGDATLSVVAATLSADAPPVLIWLAEYPTADAAKAAADRYATALKSAAVGGLDRQTQVAPAKGRVVFGTWTADDEAARNLLKMLGQALPD